MHGEEAHDAGPWEKQRQPPLQCVCGPTSPQLGSRLAPGCAHHVQVGVASHPQGCSQSK